MAEDDRQPPQAYDTVAPAGVGATTSNQVSPGTIQEMERRVSRSGTIETLTRLGRLGPRQKVTTLIGLRGQ